MYHLYINLCWHVIGTSLAYSIQLGVNLKVFRRLCKKLQWKISISLGFSQLQISAPYSKTGTTQVSKSSRTMSAGRRNILAFSVSTKSGFLACVICLYINCHLKRAIMIESNSQVYIVIFYLYFFLTKIKQWVLTHLSFRENKIILVLVTCKDSDCFWQYWFNSFMATWSPTADSARTTGLFTIFVSANCFCSVHYYWRVV